MPPLLARLERRIAATAACGASVGEIVALTLDPASGCPTHALLADRPPLGLTARVRPVPWRLVRLGADRARIEAPHNVVCAGLHVLRVVDFDAAVALRCDSYYEAAVPPARRHAPAAARLSSAA